MAELHWLPSIPDWRTRLRTLAFDPPDAWDEAIRLANARLDFLQTNALDGVFRTLFPRPPVELTTRPVRLAILGTCTVAHLLPAIRVGALRRGIWVDTYVCGYGQAAQELMTEDSALHAFQPNAVLFALDGYHLSAGLTTEMDKAQADAALRQVKADIRAGWTLARQAFHAPIIQQTPLPVHLPLLGNNEHRLSGSRLAFVTRLNLALRDMADAEGVDVLALDDRAARDGLAAWHNPALWHHAKQEVAPDMAPLYGDLVARLLTARQGRSLKCLVLDLDNTLWGGVIGDDGLEGIVLGHGSALGEAYRAVQEYARDLARRGVILAICSKNDEASALEPFEKHPEMVLRRDDIASFVANWNDKPSNLRAIAAALNIGLDAMVFLDDNPFERDLVRQALPMVAVPEVADDPAGYPQALADAGYFEALTVTEEDRARSSQYRGNRARAALQASATGLPSYLRGLEMQLTWRRFDRVGLQRIVQLINKSNQFNLTTRRYSEDEIVAVMDDPNAFGLQLRLLDRFGDNGVIAIVIGRVQETTDLYIDTWLMSCRVLGRQVEAATLNLIMAEAKRLRAHRVVGEYIPTTKNGIVKDHYTSLGFALISHDAIGSRYALNLAGFVPVDTFIQTLEG